MTRPCKYGCGTELGAFDEENRKYLEAASGGLHTKERCQEAKARLEAHNRGDKLPYDTAYDKSKDDHGNENFPPAGAKKILELTPEGMNLLKGAGLGYVDHTLKPDFNLKTLTDPTPEGIDLKYNNFAKEHKIRYSQSHVQGSHYTVYVWYEEKE